MSGKKKNVLSTSTPSAKSNEKRVPRMGKKPAALPIVEVLSDESTSPLNEAYRSHEFQTEWENQVRFQVARNLLQLRKHRQKSQLAVGELMGTSQSAIARIESGSENITLDTLQRIIEALKGRLQISIPPREFVQGITKPWWDGSHADQPWMPLAARRTAAGIELAFPDNPSTMPVALPPAIQPTAGLLLEAATSDRG